MDTPDPIKEILALFTDHSANLKRDHAEIRALQLAVESRLEALSEDVAKVAKPRHILPPGQFHIRISPAGDLHATLDAMRAELDRLDTRLLPPAQPGQPSSDKPSSPHSPPHTASGTDTAPPPDADSIP